MACCGRRQVLGATGVIASGIVLGGCGTGSDGSTGSDAAPDTGATTAASGAVGDETVASTSDVPVGGGTVVEEAQVVLTQPTEGEFKAFSAVCPHQGCLVTDVRDGAIVCPCHGSRFDVATGGVLAGPATSGLSEKRVTVTDGGISVA